MEFKVGQQFRVPNITWTVKSLDERTVLIHMDYADNSKPVAEMRRTLDELRWTITRARELGRLIEDPETVEE